MSYEIDILISLKESPLRLYMWKEKVEGTKIQIV